MSAGDENQTVGKSGESAGGKEPNRTPGRAEG
jgi:hypothetical protein